MLLFGLHFLITITCEETMYLNADAGCYLIRDAMELASENNPMLGQICLYVAQDCTGNRSRSIGRITR